MAAETNKLRIWGESLGQPVRSSRIPGGLGGSDLGSATSVMVLKPHQKLGEKHAANRQQNREFPVTRETLLEDSRERQHGTQGIFSKWVEHISSSEQQLLRIFTRNIYAS